MRSMAVTSRTAPLTKSGLVAATLLGILAALGGWRFLALLIAYFFPAIALSRFRKAEKDRRSHGVLEKSGARDATQVVVNGGLFAACALVALWGNSIFHNAMLHAALGALAASSADTWATEIGILYGGAPVSVRTFKRVQAGTSGAVSIPGILAMIGGAAWVGFVSSALALSTRAGIILAGGVAGALMDTLLGATVQERRYCPACNADTERRVHNCGAATTLTHGYSWMDNDFVNLLATFVGAAVAATLATF